LRPYSPGGALYAFAQTARPSASAPSSAHGLRPGLPGYLIPFAPLAFAPQRQSESRSLLSPSAFLPISTHFTAPPAVPAPPPPLETTRIEAHSPVKPGDFSTRRGHPSTRPLSPMIPNNVRTVRLTAAAGTNLARASSRGRSRPVLRRPFLPLDRSLQPEGLRPPRGVARSGLRPLPKILDCSLP
jgi:hypothetical protein